MPPLATLLPFIEPVVAAPASLGAGYLAIVGVAVLMAIFATGPRSDKALRVLELLLRRDAPRPKESKQRERAKKSSP
ncbi:MULTISPECIES: hypothetical protein [unclassified Rathayibacter]|uniref:hypothetical protein n=1 Tax=unclassified Rathayibacter TaxID=2609250 RepID=UPI001E5B3C77|nr:MULTISPECIES: hypothetical protein [unclassified Rathayibacter]